MPVYSGPSAFNLNVPIIFHPLGTFCVASAIRLSGQKRSISYSSFTGLDLQARGDFYSAREGDGLAIWLCRRKQLAFACLFWLDRR